MKTPKILLAFLVAMLFASIAPAALCPAGHGPFGSTVISPDGARAVCLADPVAGKYELFSAGALDANFVRLSPDLGSDRDVTLFAISPDSRRVVFVCDPGSWTKYELFSVPIGGGAIVKLSQNLLPHEHDVDRFWISSDSSRVVFLQGRNTTGEWSLYSSPIANRAVVRLSPPAAVGGGVERTTVELDGPRALFSANLDGGATFVRYVVPIAGGQALPKTIFKDGFESGNLRLWE